MHTQVVPHDQGTRTLPADEWQFEIGPVLICRNNRPQAPKWSHKRIGWAGMHFIGPFYVLVRHKR